MVSLDAHSLSARELNQAIKKAALTGSQITILNPQARHNIAVGILDSCKIDIDGSVGYYAASLMDGHEVNIDGNAGWALG